MTTRPLDARQDRAPGSGRRRTRPRCRRTAPCWRSPRTPAAARRSCRSSPCARGRCSSSPQSTATASGTTGRSRPPPPPCTRRRPSRALLPKALSRPPITAVGSSPARSSTSAIIDVVVVLPCEPGHRNREPQPHQLGQHLGARDHRNRRAARASTISGFVGRTADEYHHHVGVADVGRRVPLEHASRRTPTRAAPSRPTASRPSRSPRSRGSRAARRCRSCRCRPTPTKCTRRVLPSIRRCVRPAERQHPVDDHPRRVGPRHAAAPPPPSARARPPSRASASNLRAPAARRSARAARSSRAAPCRTSASRVLALVVVGGGRQRNQDRRPCRPPSAPPASSRPARQTTTSAALISRSIVEQERLDPGLEPAPPVRRRGPSPDRALRSDA